MAELVVANWYEPLIEHAHAIFAPPDNENLQVFIRRLAGAVFKSMRKPTARTDTLVIDVGATASDSFSRKPCGKFGAFGHDPEPLR